MASHIFADDRQAVYDIVKAFRCKDAKYVFQQNNYEELFAWIHENCKWFDCDFSYLENILNVFEDEILIDNNICYNKTIVDISNIIIAAKVNITGTLTLDSGDTIPFLYIHDACNIAKISVENETTLEYLHVSGGSIVSLVDIADGSVIDHVAIITCNGDNISTITKLNSQKNIAIFDIEENGVYDGVLCTTTIPATTTVPATTTTDGL